MTRGHPQTKQSRKTARRKSQQLQRMVAGMLAEPKAAPTLFAPTLSSNVVKMLLPLRVETFDRASVMAVLGVPSTIRRI